MAVARWLFGGLWRYTTYSVPLRVISLVSEWPTPKLGRPPNSWRNSTSGTSASCSKTLARASKCLPCKFQVAHVKTGELRYCFGRPRPSSYELSSSRTCWGSMPRTREMISGLVHQPLSLPRASSIIKACDTGGSLSAWKRT